MQMCTPCDINAVNFISLKYAQYQGQTMMYYLISTPGWQKQLLLSVNVSYFARNDIFIWVSLIICVVYYGNACKQASIHITSLARGNKPVRGIMSGSIVPGNRHTRLALVRDTQHSSGRQRAVLHTCGPITACTYMADAGSGYISPKEIYLAYTQCINRLYFPPDRSRSVVCIFGYFIKRNHLDYTKSVCNSSI